MRRMFSGRTKWLVIGLLLVLGGLGPVTWLKRADLLAWYYVRQLSSADEAHRDTWIERLLALDDLALPRLIGCLSRHDSQGCANAQAALLSLIKRTDENSRWQLARQLAEAFPRCSVYGQPSVLEVEAALVEGSVADSERIIGAAAGCLHSAQSATDKEVHARALALARTLLVRTRKTEVISACRTLVHSCLGDAEVENRADAVQLALHPQLHLLEEVVGLLDDPSPEIRRLALVALGPSESAISTDDLLRWLHDPDREVRRLCESALRARNLSENQIRLGRTLTDPQPGIRLQVMDALRHQPDIEPGVWLRRLSHDPEPAVRAAAIRAAAEQPFVNFSDRLAQMSMSDPSLTVRQLALHYRDLQKSQDARLSGQ